MKQLVTMGSVNLILIEGRIVKEPAKIKPLTTMATAQDTSAGQNTCWARQDLLLVGDQELYPSYSGFSACQMDTSFMKEYF